MHPSLIPYHTWDLGAAKGRTSCKIHERFQYWAGVKSVKAQDIVALKLWTSISPRPLPRMMGVGMGFREGVRYPSVHKGPSLSPDEVAGHWGEA